MRAAFGEGRLAEEVAWKAVVLIPKGKGYYHGICLVEVLWKVVVVVLNRRLTSSITYNNFIHGSRAGRGTGTATLKVKLLQQLAAMREKVLYLIFLELQNVYVPWTGKDACKYWRDTVWGLDTAASSP